MPIELLVICAVAILFVVSSIRVLKESQRAVIFRLGQFVGVGGPGLVFLVPVVDKVKILDLNKWVPGWQALSKTDLDERVKAVVFSHQAD
ncbi:MAG TPA: SPFH domain-containing protein [Desulfomonilaceae bacterium]|nr:SPFH domain-containing protein [Desulfomonilaceae bacterium]